MQKNLVIVESPAKAKTIEKYLGKNFKVVSSYGHIRDLREKKFAIEIKKDLTPEKNYNPDYAVPKDKLSLVSALRQEAQEADIVWLASDEDREGEAISWHLKELLGVEDRRLRRIVFHEITKMAILHAIENPRTIDKDLVDAQQARRVIDRIVGFELSPVLWRRVRPSLSAGRVQSVAVRLLVEREREIAAFVSEATFRVLATFILPDGSTRLHAELNKRLKTKEAAIALLQLCQKAAFSIESITTKPVKKSPAPPFTTSTLQQEAAHKLNFPVSLTMSVAQRLYEAGMITYMRTDSVNLSSLALADAKKTILAAYGAKYYYQRHFQTHSKGAQEAHEAIRPTDMGRSDIPGSIQEKRLYELIRKRTIAGQMADAELERTTITIKGNPKDLVFTATGEVIVFDGFLQVYNESSEEESETKETENGLLPVVHPNEKLSLKQVEAIERFSQRPPRYTEASLVRRLEELGIGRPSTYAPTIQTIQNRAYVVKGNKEGVKRSYCILTMTEKGIKETSKQENIGADKNKLLPTDTGTVVTDFLIENFSSVLDYNFTADIEKEFDTIAEGKINWKKVIDKFYIVFHPKVDEVSNAHTEKRVGARVLGIDPKSGKEVSVRIGRFGPCAQIGTAQEEDAKPQFASLEKEQSIHTITLEEALRLFELPRTVGVWEKDEAIVAGIGRFGPYLRYNGKFVSIPKELNPHTITLEESIKVIEAKQLADSQRVIKRFAAVDSAEDIEVLRGRFCPYLAQGDITCKLPATIKNPEDITFEEATSLIEAAKLLPKEFKGRRGKAGARAKAKPATRARATKAFSAPKAAPKAASKKAAPKKAAPKVVAPKKTAPKKK